jgi:hypothetical protein
VFQPVAGKPVAGVVKPPQAFVAEAQSAVHPGLRPVLFGVGAPVAGVPLAQVCPQMPQFIPQGALRSGSPSVGSMSPFPGL